MPDRGVYRGIYSALPDDPDFQRLPSDARLVLYTVRVCKSAGPAAIFRYYPELLMAQTGLSRKALDAALVALEMGRWIEREGVVLWVRNGLRYDPSIRLVDKKHLKSVERAIAELPRLSIVLRFCEYYEMARPFEGPSKGYPGLALREGYREGYREGEGGTTLSGSSPDGMALNGHTAGRNLVDEAREVIGFLNHKTGRHYQATGANLELVLARLRAGATLNQCRAIIGRKTADWKGNADMNPYLRPATLFNRTKFAQYLGELPATAFEAVSHA